MRPLRIENRYGEFIWVDTVTNQDGKAVYIVVHPETGEVHGFASNHAPMTIKRGYLGLLKERAAH